MAKTENKPAAEENMENSAPVEGKKGRGKLIIILAVVAFVLLLVGGGVLAWLLFGGSGGSEGEVERPGLTAADELRLLREEAAKKRKDTAAPIYVELEKFTANLKADPNEENYDPGLSGVAVATFSLKVDSLQTEAEVKAHMPEIRNQVLRMIGSRTFSELESVEGKEQLSNDILVQINRILDPQIARIYALQQKAPGAGQPMTGHDVATDTSGVHEGSAPRAAGSLSAEELESLAAALPVQKVMYTQFILQRI